MHRDSGTMRGRRTVSGGKARIRAVLYMGALVASRHNPAIRICLPEAAGRRHAQETGPDCLHAQTPDHTQRLGQKPSTGILTQAVWTSKTVAFDYLDNS